MVRGHKLHILFILLLPMLLLMPTLLQAEVALAQEGSSHEAPPSTNAEKRTIQIKIKEKASGKPMNGVEVHVSSASGWAATGKTSSSGIAKFSNVPQGEVRVSVPTQQGWKKSGAVVGDDESSTEISLEKEPPPQRDEGHDGGHDRGSEPSH